MLVRHGHRVVGLDTSTRLVHAAAQHPAAPALVADAARPPFAGAMAEFVVLLMVLRDLDDLAATVTEAARVLVPGGRLAVPSGTRSRGSGTSPAKTASGPYILQRPYFEPRRPPAG